MTLRNLCPNPTAKNNATGWGGPGTPVRQTSLTGMPRSTGVRCTTGTNYVQTPTGSVAAGDVITVSFYIKNSTGGTIASGKQVFVAYTRSVGGDTFPESFNTAALGVDGNVQRASFTCAAAPANATGIYLVIDQLPTNVDITAVAYDPSGTLNAYKDGDDSGWAWDGTDGNSSSSEAAPAGLGVTVWNGSTELPVGSVTVWDGATEQPASVAEIA